MSSQQEVISFGRNQSVGIPLLGLSRTVVWIAQLRQYAKAWFGSERSVNDKTLKKNLQKN